MIVIITLVYFLFALCMVFPPDELVSAGLTPRHLLDGYLDSENTNFVYHHMKRIGATVFLQSLLPAGYVLTLWAGRVQTEWLMGHLALSLLAPTACWYILYKWFEYGMKKHPIARSLAHYVAEPSDWRIVADSVNQEFRQVDKVIIQLNCTSQLIATQSWLIKVSQHRVDIIKQADAILLASTMDIHESLNQHEEIQRLNVECFSGHPGVPGFKFRITTAELQETLNPRLIRPVHLHSGLRLLPSRLEHFLDVFREVISDNPVYYIDEEPEMCIGCMSTPADVKLRRRCAGGAGAGVGAGGCGQCRCRPLWCCGCLARWWAARAPAADWLTCAGTCPLCRAVFCLQDVSVVRRQPT